MKKTISLVLFCSIVAIAFAQPPKKMMLNDESGDVKERLEQLFKYAHKKQYVKAAELIAYKGVDTLRKMKDVLNPATTEELDQATGVCMNLNSIDSAAMKKEFFRFYVQKQPEGLWYNWMMLYHINPDAADTLTFGFLKIKDKYTLAGVK